MKEKLLAKPLKRAIMKANPTANYEFRLNDIVINDTTTGCTGFIRNNDNNSYVFISTDTISAMTGMYMYRYADSFSDFYGYHNRWAKSLDELTTEVIKLLKVHVSETQDRRL